MAIVPAPGVPVERSDDPRLTLTDPAPFEDEGARMSFLEHLDELRKRLIYSVYSLVFGCVIAFIFVGRIQDAIWTPLATELHGTKFMYTAGFEPFMLTMKIGVLAGLLIAAPLIFYQLWLFIAPGLYAHEKKYAIPFVLFCSLFFLGGAAFSHLVAFPWTWKFFLGWETAYMEFRPSIRETFGLYVKMLLAFGIIFQMPTVVFFLARMRMVTARFLARHTKYAVLIIFIIAAVISPGTDVVSQALMAGPMIALYGISIVVAWVVAPRAKEDA